MARKASSRSSATGGGKKAAGTRRAKTLKKPPAKKAKKLKKAGARGKASPHSRRLTTSPLKSSELEKFRQMLLEKRSTLIGDMSGIEAGAFRTNRQEGGDDLSKAPTHPADVGTDNYEQEFTLGLLESERALLNEINGALERINNRTYGICLGTGGPIGKGRLQARPWAKYCIKYAHMLEKGLVRPQDDQLTDQDKDSIAEDID